VGWNAKHSGSCCKLPNRGSSLMPIITWLFRHIKIL
jgi:hypothetical protein